MPTNDAPPLNALIDFLGELSRTAATLASGIEMARADFERLRADPSPELAARLAELRADAPEEKPCLNP